MKRKMTNIVRKRRKCNLLRKHFDHLGYDLFNSFLKNWNEEKLVSFKERRNLREKENGI